MSRGTATRRPWSARFVTRVLPNGGVATWENFRRSNVLATGSDADMATPLYRLPPCADLHNPSGHCDVLTPGERADCDPPSAAKLGCAIGWKRITHAQEGNRVLVGEW